jgi:putative peptidoglycan lipid II flippase
MAPESTTAETPEKASGSGSGGSAHALLVAGGIFLSRIAGFIRLHFFSHYFGNSPVAGAFTAALRIPNFLQNLFGEGVLSGSFIPVYARLIAEGKRELAGRVAGAVAALLGLFVSVIAVIGVVATPLFVDLLAPGFDGEVRALTIRIVRVLFPGTALLVMSAWCLGILNSHRKFFISYVAPVLWNGAMIAALVIFGGRRDADELAVILAWGMVAGSLLQVGVQLPFVFSLDRDLRFALATTLDPVRTVIRNVGPVILGRGVIQVSGYIDEIIASFLGTMAMAGLGYSQMLYLLPVSLFGMSVAAAELPQMSSAIGTPGEILEKVRGRIEAGQRQIAFFIAPTTVAYLLIGDRFVAGLYETGQFGPHDTRYVWYILIGSTIGLFAATQSRLCSSAFYAMHDTKTPLWFAIIQLALTTVLGLLFAFPLRPAVIAFFEDVLRLPIPELREGRIALGAAALTASAGIAAWIGYLLMRRALERRIGVVSWAAAFQAKVWGAAIVAGAGAALFSVFAVPLAIAEVGARVHPMVTAVAVAAVFGVVYLSLTLALRVPEARLIGRMLRRGR